MKRISLPKAEQIDGAWWTASRVLLQLVMTRSEWRSPLERSRAALNIIEKLETIEDAYNYDLKKQTALVEIADSARDMDITDGEWELLCGQMELRDSAGATTTFQSMRLNRFYLRINTSVLGASSPPPVA